VRYQAAKGFITGQIRLCLFSASLDLQGSRFNGMGTIVTFRLDCDQALHVARTFFGTDGQAIELSGERTQNFHVVSNTGEYLLKISDPVEDVALVDLETRVLQHIARTDPTLPVPEACHIRGLAEHPTEL
jgi:hypothetical protein